MVPKSEALNMYNTGALYEMQIRPNGRAAADEYYHNGNTWIEGREGSKYTIFLKNNDWRRAQFIVSVDGLDVLDGRPAGIQSRGYVLNPNQSMEIPGWRLNNREAAEFYFSKKNNSYVSEIGGNANNAGVIGIMVFAERQVQNSPYDIARIARHAGNNLYTASTNSAIPTQYTSSMGSGQITANNATLSIGTGFGEAIGHQTRETTFIRNNDQIHDGLMVVYYDTAENLKRMGIQLKTRYTSSTPNPFPAGGTYNTGCVPPPSWVK